MIFIKLINTTIAFGCGVGAGLLYDKYNKDIMNYFKKANKKVKEIK